MLEQIRLVLSILPLIIDTIRKLEEIFPDSGFGSLKFDLIVETLTETSDEVKDAIPLVKRMINIVVSIFNRFGIFKKAKEE